MNRPAPLPDCMMPDGGDPCPFLRRVILERDCYRAVLEGAGYRNIDEYADNGEARCRMLGVEVARATIEALNAKAFVDRVNASHSMGELPVAISLLTELVELWDEPRHDFHIAPLIERVRTFLNQHRRLT